MTPCCYDICGIYVGLNVRQSSCKVEFQVPGMAEKREHSSHPKGDTGSQLAVGLGSKASGYVGVDFKDHHVCPIGQQESLSLQTGRMTDD